MSVKYLVSNKFSRTSHATANKLTIIGRGSTAVVWKLSNRKLILKEFKNSKNALNHKENEEIVYRIIFTTENRNKNYNFCKLYPLVHHQTISGFLLEYGGTKLSDFISNLSSLSAYSLHCISLQIIHAFRFMLRLNINHNDISPNNILVLSLKRPLTLEIEIEDVAHINNIKKLLITTNYLVKVIDMGNSVNIYPEHYGKELVILNAILTSQIPIVSHCAKGKCDGYYYHLSQDKLDNMFLAENNETSTQFIEEFERIQQEVCDYYLHNTPLTRQLNIISEIAARCKRELENGPTQQCSTPI